MLSNSDCNHTCDKQIRLLLHGRPILLSFVWLWMELDSTQSYYHYWWLYIYYFIIIDCQSFELYIFLFSTENWELIERDLEVCCTILILSCINNILMFKPLTPMTDQNRISPDNTHTISSRQAMRKKKDIN